MRILIYNRSIIEMQSHATPGTLIANAINAGYSESEIEEREVSEAEYAELARVQAESEITYIERRKAEYPPYTDYLDAIVKGDTAQAQAYIDACLAVKERYPKNVPTIQ